MSWRRRNGLLLVSGGHPEKSFLETPYTRSERRGAQPTTLPCHHDAMLAWDSTLLTISR